MCKVLSRYEEGISQLAQFLEIYVTELGSDALEQICDAAKEVKFVYFLFKPAWPWLTLSILLLRNP